MKKLILIALVCSALYSSATGGYFGVKPIVNEPACYGQTTASVQLSVLGGTAPYTYHWSGGLAPTNPVSNIPAGTYSVTVTDANGLIANYTLTIGQPYALDVTTGAVNVGIHGGNNGSANANVDGGTPGYTYDWSNGATTQNIGNLASGVYTVTVTDAVGCTSTASQTVTQPAARVTFNGQASLLNSSYEKADGPNSTGSPSAKGEGATGLSNQPELKAEDVQLFPNPATSTLTLKTADVSGAQITLFDINGQKVSEQIAESNESSINVSSLPAGNYVVEIKTSNSNVISKKVSVTK